ncbi:hypothetical protein A6R68_08583 [Neotoma lepida]|uniref:Uncharacterized protein n=1 Tax=Neotoma lepida TaxID=56216 RepID=A0A1A6G2C3_NEOLE|nr:hypothetical protein A6R68_08583 [Neotoma lepida]
MGIVVKSPSPPRAGPAHGTTFPSCPATVGGAARLLGLGEAWRFRGRPSVASGCLFRVIAVSPLPQGCRFTIVTAARESADSTWRSGLLIPGPRRTHGIPGRTPDPLKLTDDAPVPSLSPTVEPR